MAECYEAGSRPQIRCTVRWSGWWRLAGGARPSTECGDVGQRLVPELGLSVDGSQPSPWGWAGARGEGASRPLHCAARGSERAHAGGALSEAQEALVCGHLYPTALHRKLGWGWGWVGERTRHLTPLVIHHPRMGSGRPWPARCLLRDRCGVTALWG